MANTNLSSDVYGISEFINGLKKQFTDIKEETLYMGIFGYTSEVFSNLFQNSIVMASEYSNESIPYKAKFEKNIITHALSLGFTDINAVPSSMNILLGFVESELVDRMKNNGNSNRFVFDKDSQFYIEDFEFHLDYDIIITRNFLSSGTDTYTARYDMTVPNQISNIINPYLTPPVRMQVQGSNIIYVQCTIRQVEEQKIYKKLLTDNIIENKTLSFDFDSQLAAFDIDVTENDVTTHLIPMYEGIYNNTLSKNCYYSYIDANTIRVKFNRDSYEPKINSDVVVNLKTTKGIDGNFTYKNDLTYVFSSDRFNYSNITCSIKPITDAQFGSNKKSIEDLKKIIPKESSARGSITNTSDLENFFNMLDTDSNKVYFYKKIDNQLERAYYSYIILKNDINNIIPTNTIDLRVQEADFKTVLGAAEQSNPVISTGRIIKYGIPFCTLEDTVGPDVAFRYTTPFMMVINRDPLYVSYYMNIIDMNRYLDFTYINDNSTLQFISTSIGWKRQYLTDRNKYKINMRTMQNITSDVGMIELNPDGTIKTCNIKIFAILYKQGSPYRYTEATIVSYDPEVFSYDFQFVFETNDVINTDNLIRIENLYDIKTTTKSYGYLEGNTKVILYILSKQDKEYGRDDIDLFIPGLTGYTLSNKYTITDGIDFFYNYTHLISSNIVPRQNPDKTVYYEITSIPVIKHDYIDSEAKIKDLTYQLDKRKEYIDYSLKIIEDSFGIDFKFFNTYGPSKTFAINDGQYINSVSLSMKFRVKFINTSDSYLKEYIVADIKKYIEDINTISDLHIPNLITMITNNYRDQLVYFEFLDMNGYGPGYQHIFNMESNSITTVPELLNISNDIKGVPMIDIMIV